MPVIDRQDASDVEQHIARIFSSNSPEERVREIRRLFVEKLDFEQSSGVVSLQDAPARVELPAAAHQIATLEDAHVVYVHLGYTPGSQSRGVRGRAPGVEPAWRRHPHGLHQRRSRPAALHIPHFRGDTPHPPPHGHRARPATSGPPSCRSPTYSTSGKA